MPPRKHVSSLHYFKRFHKDIAACLKSNIYQIIITSSGSIVVKKASNHSRKSLKEDADTRWGHHQCRACSGMAGGRCIWTQSEMKTLEWWLGVQKGSLFCPRKKKHQVQMGSSAGTIWIRLLHAISRWTMCFTNMIEHRVTKTKLMITSLGVRGKNIVTLGLWPENIPYLLIICGQYSKRGWKKTNPVTVMKFKPQIRAWCFCH